MDLIQAIEIFAFVTGLAYIVLEIFQKNAMWVLGIATGIACAYSFGVQKIWASMALNIYYVGVSVWGLWKWSRASKALEAANSTQEDGGASVHLSGMTRTTAAVSIVLFVAGTLLLWFILRATQDANPWLDSIVSVMSAIATWWLAKSIPQQWLVWIVADILSMILCLTTGMYWMGALYLFYSLAAVFGWYHWTTHGRYIDA